MRLCCVYAQHLFVIPEGADERDTRRCFLRYVAFQSNGECIASKRWIEGEFFGDAPLNLDHPGKGGGLVMERSSLLIMVARGDADLAGSDGT